MSMLPSSWSPNIQQDSSDSCNIGVRFILTHVNGSFLNNLESACLSLIQLHGAEPVHVAGTWSSGPKMVLHNSGWMLGQIRCLPPSQHDLSVL